MSEYDDYEKEVGDFDTDDLVEELRCRGYEVLKKTKENTFLTVEWHIRRGNLYEAALELERNIPNLKGMSDLVVTISKKDDL